MKESKQANYQAIRKSKQFRDAIGWLNFFSENPYAPNDAHPEVVKQATGALQYIANLPSHSEWTQEKALLIRVLRVARRVKTSYLGRIIQADSTGQLEQLLKTDIVVPEVTVTEPVSVKPTPIAKIDAVPEYNADLKAYTNTSKKLSDHVKEAMHIGLVTQFKRFLRHMFPDDKNFQYFSNQTKDDIYQKDSPVAKVDSGLRFQNIGHATQLLQFEGGLNVLTDPAFFDLNTLLYPSQTQPGISLNDLPNIDVIMISHNHRDHLDVKSLKELAKRCPNATLVVPAGDLSFDKFLEQFNFAKVRKLEWYQSITFTKNEKPVDVIAVPADHWSNRSVDDVNQSSANGYLVNPKQQNALVYFPGDTAYLDDERYKGIAMLIKQLAMESLFKDVYHFVPGGPNYPHNDMAPTHQSAVDSMNSAIRLVHFVITKLEKEIPPDKNKVDIYLAQISTIFMHHNKYELGTDRFNENLFIYQEAVHALLHLSDEQLNEKIAEEKNKNHRVASNEGRNKAFIYESLKELRSMTNDLYPNNEAANKQVAAYLLSRVFFPKIGQAHSGEALFPTFAKTPTQEQAQALSQHAESFTDDTTNKTSAKDVLYAIADVFLTLLLIGTNVSSIALLLVFGRKGANVSSAHASVFAKPTASKQEDVTQDKTHRISQK